MKPYRYLLLTTLSLSLFACSKEDGGDEPIIDPNTPVALSPQIASVALTKAAATSSDVKAIGLYAVNNASGETHYGSNGQGTYGQYTLQDGSLKPASASHTIWLSMQQARVYSYHPATASNQITVSGSSPSYTYTIPVPANAIVYTQTIPNASSLDFTTPQTDYMYGVAYNTSTKTFSSDQPIADNGHAPAGSPTPKGPTINIGLKHAFCQVALKFKKNDDYVGPCNLTKITYSRSMPTLKADNTSTMNLADGTLANLTAAATATPVKYEYTTTQGVAATTEGIEIVNYGIPFASNAPNITPANLTITVDGKEMTLSDISDGGEWKPGHKYTYTISIHGTGLKLDGFNVVGWVNESSDNTNTTI